MIEVDLHRVSNQTGLGMFIPEHAKVSHADGRHQRADHLVELAGGGSQYSSESGSRISRKGSTLAPRRQPRPFEESGCSDAKPELDP